MRTRSAASTRAAVAAYTAIVLAVACARIDPPQVVPAPRVSQYELALAAFDRADFLAADAMLRASSASCDAPDTRRSLLLLSALWLDPRNRLAHADSALMFAARVLFHPGADVGERVTARSLYLLALELGADPRRPERDVELRPVAGSRGCDVRSRESLSALPVLENEPLSAAVQRLERQRDSLAARNKSLSTDLQAALAEIQRIRLLLGGRDTTKIPRRP